MPQHASILHKPIYYTGPLSKSGINLNGPEMLRHVNPEIIYDS